MVIYLVIVSPLFFKGTHSLSNTHTHPSTRTATGANSRLDIPAVAQSVQTYFAHGLATSTRKSYPAASKQFHEFCQRYNINSLFLVSEKLLCCFAAALADANLKPATVKVYLSAVCNLQLSLGLPDSRDHSSLPILKQGLAGISRLQLAKGSQCTKPRLPITGPLFVNIHSSHEVRQH